MPVMRWRASASTDRRLKRQRSESRRSSQIPRHWKEQKMSN